MLPLCVAAWRACEL